MRLALTVVSPTARQWADVVLDADPATPVGEVAAELDRLANGGDGSGAQVLRFPGPHSHDAVAVARSVRGYPRQEPAAIPLYVEFQQIAPQLTLAQSPIRDGAVISLGTPEGCLRPEPTGLVEVKVVGGPASGAVHRLSLGEADIGSGGTAAIQIADQAIPPLALRVAVDPRGGTQVAPYPGIQATIDRTPMTGPGAWLPGQQIAIGSTLIGLAGYEPPDAALHPSEDGTGIDFNRPPRLLPPARVTKFRLPSPPDKQARRSLPILTAIAPMIMGVGMYFLTHEIYMLAMCGMSPLMMVFSYLNSKKEGKQSYAQKMAEYRQRKESIEREAQQAVDAERIQKREDCPDPATVLSIASGPRRRLWERRRTDPDFLLFMLAGAFAVFLASM
jgi:DNA segregation ATPase FtsK/SpoIIIE, S-DNA-T family